MLYILLRSQGFFPDSLIGTILGTSSGSCVRIWNFSMQLSALACGSAEICALLANHTSDNLEESFTCRTGTGRTEGMRPQS